MYVGAAKTAPAARAPRRLATTNSATMARPIGTAAALREGSTDVAAATPAATDTATVRMKSTISPAPAIRPHRGPRLSLATM